MKTDYLKIQNIEAVIRILEIVCQKPGDKISENQIYNKLSSDFDKESIRDALLNGIKELRRDDQAPIQSFGSQGQHFLKYLNDLENYVSNLKKMVKKEKLHRILEFISTENDRTRKSGFDSEEISKAFTPELNIYEVNALCKILLENGDVKDCTTNDVSAKRMVAILVVNATHDAYHTKKYLEEDEPVRLPFNQNIITGDNVIVGNITGSVNQEDNISESPKKKGKENRLKRIYLIIWILAGITVLITFIISIL